ncbi:MAG: DUF3145 family protein [Jatrophihabitans sp.]|nr:MAG: DUF3145 family protein [Jatrophihabitans sp.]
MTYARTAVARTRGVVYLHCVPAALTPHVEWALAAVIGRPVRLEWSLQPVAAPHLRAEAAWAGAVGTAAAIAASLRAWPMLVFEITEDATAASDGERLAYVPGRGFHRSTVAVNGDIVVGEERLRGLSRRATTVEEFRHGLDELLGAAWDAELEPYRTGVPGGPRGLLHEVV